MEHIEYIKQQRQHDENRKKGGGRYVWYGTPLFQGEEENVDVLKDNKMTKYAPEHMQVATDERGRRRFHGAFTGGFSAGYFNSVGSKHGWAPKQYVKDQKISLDELMDEEDREHMGTTRYEMNEDLKDSFTTESMTRSTTDDAHLRALFGGPRSQADHDEEDNIKLDHTLGQNIVPLKEKKLSIGVKLLQSMGWKEGEGIGPKIKRKKAKKVYGMQLPPHLQNKANSDNDVEMEEVAPKDVPVIKVHLKNDFHGLGFTSDSLHHDNPQDKDQDKYHMRELLRTSVNKYDQEYDTEITTEEESTIANRSSSTKHVTFIADGSLEVTSKYFPPPPLPKDFIPMHHFDDVDQNQDEQNASTRIQLGPNSTSERGKLLGEVPLPGAHQRSFYDYLHPQDQERIMQITPSPQQRSNLDHTQNEHTLELKKKLSSIMSNRFAPESTDLSKPVNQLPVGIQLPSTLIKQQLRRQQPIIPTPRIPHFNQKREQLEWHPEPLLCKRFTCANPYPKSTKIGTVRGVIAKKQTSIFDDSLFENKSIQNQSVDRSDQLSKMERPNMDIFEAVFKSETTSTEHIQHDDVKNENHTIIDLNAQVELIQEEEEEDDDSFPFKKKSTTNQNSTSLPNSIAPYIPAPLTNSNAIIANTVKSCPSFDVNDHQKDFTSSSSSDQKKLEMLEKIKNLKQILGSDASDSDDKQKRRERKKKRRREEKESSSRSSRREKSPTRDEKKRRRREDDDDYYHKNKHR